MLRQIVGGGGVEGDSKCELCTVVMRHHGGLRDNIGPVAASIDADAARARGWISMGHGSHLPFVPGRCVAKNCISKEKYKVAADGVVSSVTKWRVTTDDSMEAVDPDGRSTGSRNGGLFREDWPPTLLPAPQTIAEAVAIVQTVAHLRGLKLGAAQAERVALWAIDLADAYRRLGVQFAELWQQLFVWGDGVRIDFRAVFGSAHLVGLFQRITTFILAVATARIHAYDAAHPYSAAHRAWLVERGRRLGGAEAQRISFQMIYLDDGCGATSLAPDETLLQDPLQGVWEPATSTLAPRPPAAASRCDIHMAIVAATFHEAGWSTADEKRQHGPEIEYLGLIVSAGSEAAPRGGIVCPEIKRLGLLAEIASQRTATQKVTLALVERLTGRLGNIGQVVAEGKAYLAPMYAMSAGRRRSAKRPCSDTAPQARKRSRGGGFRSPLLSIQGKGPTTGQYQRCLAWWANVLSTTVRVPLATPARFPEPGEPGCAVIFTDAAREDGTGGGAFLAIARQGDTPLFLWCGFEWPADIRDALQRNLLSMPAGELSMLVGVVPPLIAACESMAARVTHLICMTDSVATRATVNHDGSPSPQLNFLVTDLTEALRRLASLSGAPVPQLLGVHVPGVRNGAADGLSRGEATRAAVLASLRAHSSLHPVEVPFPARVFDLMRAAMTIPHRHSSDTS
jgi:hypothetical protein